MLRIAMMLASLGLTSCLLTVDEKQGWACVPHGTTSGCPSGMFCHQRSEECRALDASCYRNDDCDVDYVCATDDGASGGRCEPYGRCSDDYECRYDDICEGGQCGTPECLDYGDCEGNFACDSGRCITSCDRTDDCAFNYACDTDTGKCVEESLVEACPEDCGAYACFADEGEGTCLTRCSGDQDCGDGYHCDLSTNACLIDCASSDECGLNQLCEEGVCVAQSCANDLECSSGFACRNGTCLTSCDWPIDCADGYICSYDLVCVVPMCDAPGGCRGYSCSDSGGCNFECLDEYDCLNEFACQEGQCVSRCDEARDCVQGTTCELETGYCRF